MFKYSETLMLSDATFNEGWRTRMVDLKTAIEEINTGKICFSEKEADTTMTTEGEVVIYLERLHDLSKAKEKLENMITNCNVPDKITLEVIIDILNNGTYADIFN